MNREVYPTDVLKSKFIPVRDLPKEYGISEDTAMKLVRENKVMFALMKDPKGPKRIPHIHIEQLLTIIKEKSE